MRLKLLFAALFTTGIATAAIPVDGWYSSVFGGYSYVPDNIRDYSLGYYLNSTAFNNGYNAGLRFGYQSNPLRYELEYTYIHASARFVHLNYVGENRIYGYSAANLAMANIYYDTPEMLPAIAPFLGLGVGYAYILNDLTHFGPLGYNSFDQSKNSFAYQGTMGLTYNFAENYAINIAYRYASTTTANSFGLRYQAHMASAGAIYHFDYGNYK